MHNTSIPISLSTKQIASWFESAACNLETPAPIIASVPKLQRGLVWEPSQTELLWDSLLRGFPIGSLVVCPRIPGQDVGDDAAVTHHLLDGQQRSHAMSLGYHDPFSSQAKDSNQSILWIDLQPEIPLQSTREFLLRLTTSAHPWGFTRADSCEILRAKQIREILNHVGLNPALHDYARPAPIELFPAEARVPVPMAWLLLQNSNNVELFWNNIIQKCKETNKSWATRASDFISDQSDTALSARHRVFDAIQRLAHLQVIALPSPDLLTNETRSENVNAVGHGENSAIEHLFQRLNRQGTRLDGEELAYSMIKAYWPQVAKPIENILTKRMPASRLVMMSARAALTSNDATQLRGSLSVSDIRRLASTRNEDATKVLRFIEERLKSCCEWVEEALLFHPQFNPTGLLAVHLANIARTKPEIYLLLICIADRHLHGGVAAESLDNLRKSLFALICRMSWFATDYQRATNHVLASCSGNVSATAIFEALAQSEKEGWLIPLPEPVDLSTLLDFDEKDIESWNWYSPIHGNGEQGGIDIRQRKWGAFLQCLNNRDLLLYAQRNFIVRRFPDFDPSRRDLWAGHNRPWDFDHIHASAFVHNIKTQNRFQPFLKQWINTVGNLRAWPFEDNRSDSADAADAKILNSEQLSESFIMAAELSAFSMERKPLNDEDAARKFAMACRNRLIRIYQEFWNQIH
jgi:hypothetical protein